MRLLAPLTATLLLAGCATTSTPTANSSDSREARTTAYGLFLAGQVAMNRGDSRTAADFFARAARLEPQTRSIRERAFQTALMSGDLTAALRAAPASEPTPEPATTAAAPSTPSAVATARQARETMRSTASDNLARLARASNDLAAGRGRQAREALDADFGPHELAAGLLRPWAAAAAGDWEAALARPTGANASGATGGFRELSRALLLERAGRREEADAAFTAMSGEGGYDMLTLAHGEYLERTARPADAVALYQSALARGSEDMSIRAALARAEARRRPPPAPSLRQGAGRAMLLPSVALLGAEQREIGLLYLRLVLRLDPEMHDAWLLAGDTLAQLQDYDAARAAYGRVPAASPVHAQAQARQVGVLQLEGRTDEALAFARTAAARAPDDIAFKVALAGVLIEQEDYAGALDILDAGDQAREWRVAYLRGVALERAGRWTEAEIALRAALAARPDEADILNHLGYALVDRGEKLTEASAMLDRAMQARPESGAIIDSVGWARYRQGRYDEAVRLLERAAQLEPGDATVNDHLGDAYWRVGRRIEARFQWRRALGLEPDARTRAAATAKLASEMGPDGAEAVQAARIP